MRRRILPFLLVFLALLGLLHFFIFWVTYPDMLPLAARITAVVLAVGWISGPIGILMSHGPHSRAMRPLTVFAYLWLGFFFITFSFSFVEMIISIFWVDGVSWWPWAAGCVASLWAVFRAISPPRIIRYRLAGPASMRGLKLVQISDVHIGMPFLTEAWLARQVKRINALEPDVVAVTGDLADGPFEAVSPQLAPLAGLHPRLRKFYVTGNHEFIRGGDWETRLNELGFKVLHNTNEIFDRAGGRFLIGGIPDRAILHRGERFESSPSKALSSSEAVDYRVLLAHEPKVVSDLGGARCDLLLSGHVHGGQIFPFGFLVHLAQPLSRGFKRIHGTLVFAHMGTGFWGPPMRWLTRSEIVEFEWVENAPEPRSRLVEF